MCSARNADAPAETRARRDGNRDQFHTSAPQRSAATTGLTRVTTDCACLPCADLLAECGEHFALYSKKLLVVGWSGAKSPVETAYVRAHRSDAQQAAAMASGARLKAVRAATQTLPTDGATGAGGGRATSAATPTLPTRVVAAGDRGAA